MSLYINWESIFKMEKEIRIMTLKALGYSKKEAELKSHYRNRENCFIMGKIL